MIHPTVRGICLAISLALVSVPWADALAAAPQQTLGALKPKKNRPAGFPCDKPGDINPDQSIPQTDYVLAKVLPSSDPTLCYLACLKDTNCKSVGVFPATLDGCNLYSDTLLKGSQLNFKAKKKGGGRFTSRQCLTSRTEPINPPNESCDHKPGDYFALRVSGPASDYRNGYWVTTPSVDGASGFTPALAIGSGRKQLFYIEPKNTTLKLSSGERYATYANDLTDSLLFFQPPDFYDSESRAAIPIKCAITNGRLICSDGDPEIPPTSTPKKFSFSLCINIPTNGYPTVFSFPLPFVPGIGHGETCNGGDQKIDLIAYYPCF